MFLRKRSWIVVDVLVRFHLDKSEEEQILNLTTVCDSTPIRCYKNGYSIVLDHKLPLSLGLPLSSEGFVKCWQRVTLLFVSRILLMCDLGI